MTTDVTDDRRPPHPRSAIADAVLADAPAHLDADAVAAVLDATMSATEAACLNGDPLLDFDEYREVAL